MGAVGSAEAAQGVVHPQAETKPGRCCQGSFDGVWLLLQAVSVALVSSAKRR